MLDIELVKYCQEWKLDYFWVLYDRYIDNIYKFIYIKVSNKEIAEDLTSEVFLKSLNKINNFKEKKWATFKSWIYKIAYNLVIDFYRTKRDNLSLDDYMNLERIIDLWKDIDNKNKIKEVLKYLNTLKKEHKEIIILRVWYDLSYKEISEITSIKIDNCKQIFCRTIKKVNSNVILLILLFINL